MLDFIFCTLTIIGVVLMGCGFVFILLASADYGVTKWKTWATKSKAYPYRPLSAYTTVGMLHSRSVPLVFEVSHGKLTGTKSTAWRISTPDAGTVWASEKPEWVT